MKKTNSFIYILLRAGAIALRLVVIKPWRLFFDPGADIPPQDEGHDIFTVVRDYPELELLPGLLDSPSLKDYELSRQMQTEGGQNRALCISAADPATHNTAVQIYIYYPGEDGAGEAGEPAGGNAPLTARAFLEQDDIGRYQKISLGQRTVYYINHGGEDIPYMEFYLPWGEYLYSGNIQGADQTLVARLINDMMTGL